MSLLSLFEVQVYYYYFLNCIIIVIIGITDFQPHSVVIYNSATRQVADADCSD